MYYNSDPGKENEELLEALTVEGITAMPKDEALISSTPTHSNNS
jgi:hypothetical protein